MFIWRGLRLIPRKCQAVFVWRVQHQSSRRDLTIPIIYVLNIYLEVGYSHSCNHSKHNQEHASDNRLWNGDENRSKLAEDSQDDHQDPRGLDD